MLARAIAENLPQRGDRAAQRVLLDHGALPHRVEQRLLLEQAPGPLDHEQQRVVEPARELNRRAVGGRERALEPVQPKASELDQRIVFRHVRGPAEFFPKSIRSPAKTVGPRRRKSSERSRGPEADRWEERCHEHTRGSTNASITGLGTTAGRGGGRRRGLWGCRPGRSFRTCYRRPSVRVALTTSRVSSASRARGALHSRRRTIPNGRSRTSYCVVACTPEARAAATARLTDPANAHRPGAGALAAASSEILVRPARIRVPGGVAAAAADRAASGPRRASLRRVRRRASDLARRPRRAFRESTALVRRLEGTVRERRLRRGDEPHPRGPVPRQLRRRTAQRWTARDRALHD